tara:strand:+ start:2006 stop:2803 length:798 start_codon:yes stop_codon:yes gene_type:complete
LGGHFFDNQSSDNSKKIFEQFKEDRFKYFLSPKFIKLYKARNEAIKNATGNFLAFLDCDDWWEPNHLENANFFFENNQYKLYFSNAFNYLEKRNKFILHRKNLPKENIFKDLVKDYSVKMSSLILRINIIKQYGTNPFNENFNIIGDYDLVMKIASKYLCYSNKIPSVNCSFHGENYSIKNRNEHVKEFNKWFQKIDFNDQAYYSSKTEIDDNLLYVNLFEDITTNKKPNQILKVLKLRNLYKKIKLMIILILPEFLIKRLLNKY